MANSYIYNLTDSRWQSANVEYQSIKISIINPNSHSNSSLIVFEYGSDVNFRVRQDGTIYANGNIETTNSVIATGNLTGSFVLGQLVTSNTAVPGGPSSNGVPGMIRYDDNYVYICVGSNSWKRVALTTW